MRKLGLKDEEADRLYSKTDEGLLRATVDHVEQRMRNSALAPLTVPAAYLRDALKKGYAAAAAPDGEKRAAPAPIEPPKPIAVKASVQSIRDEWERAQARVAEEHFASLGANDRAEMQRHFEESQLAGMMEPIARAWRRDGPASKIASPIFFRWLARRSSQAEPTEKDLLEFAIAKGMLNVS